MMWLLRKKKLKFDFLNGYGIGTVSYTHLDVYKRQTEGLARVYSYLKYIRGVPQSSKVFFMSSRRKYLHRWKRLSIFTPVS